MPRGALRKYAKAETHTFSLDGEVFRLARQLVRDRLGKSLNEVINEYLTRLVKELSGGQESVAFRYECLKREHLRVSIEVKRLTGFLDQRMLSEMKLLAYDLGLDFETFSNIKDVVAALLKLWGNPNEHQHAFITLLEAVAQKKQIEQELTQLRKKLYFSNEGSVNVEEGVSNTYPLPGAGSVSGMRELPAGENPRSEIPV